eukprot:m.14293 g.14293  ORF g.14293 m.14293 type:complete len:297 (-) comp10072_c0_seq2:114-1004(-)
MAPSQPVSRSSYDELVWNMVASSSCVATAVTLFNPLDCYRIRWQVQSTHKTMLSHARGILKNEGLIRGLWLPGIGANALGSGLCRGIGMGCYPTVRDWLGAEQDGKSGATMFAAGLISGGFGYGISTPLWQVKTRIQAGYETGRVYRNMFDGLKTIWTTEGGAALYRGASALIVRGALMNSGNTLGYDFIKTYNKKHAIISEGPRVHVVASVVAAFLSSTFSCPADVVMTRFQTAKQMGIEYKGVSDCVVSILRTEGAQGFFRGWLPLFSRVCPLYILYLPAYEQVRILLGLDYLN